MKAKRCFQCNKRAKHIIERPYPYKETDKSVLLCDTHYKTRNETK